MKKFVLLSICLLTFVSSVFAVAPNSRYNPTKKYYTSWSFFPQETFVIGKGYSQAKLYTCAIPDSLLKGGTLVYKILYTDTSRNAYRNAKIQISTNVSHNRTFTLVEDSCCVPFRLSNNVFTQTLSDSLLSYDFNGNLYITAKLQCNKLYKLTINQPFRTTWYQDGGVKQNYITKEWFIQYIPNPTYVPFIIE
jgi:hypothetical protein